MNPVRDLLGQLDIEWLAMKAGLKPANRITVAPERAGEVEARAQRDGFFVTRAAHVIEFPGRPPSIILYVAPDHGYAQSLVEAEAPLLPPGKAKLPVDEAVSVHTRLGRLLGFPACCADEFGVRLRRGVTRRLDGQTAHEDFVAAECAVRASRRFFGRLNDLSPDRRVRIVTFYPCRYDCPVALEYAAGVFAAAARWSPPAAAALRTALLSTMSIATDGSRGSAEQLPGEVVTVTFGEF